MLQDYPKGSNNNDEGYETSGTAFMTYGLFRGLNSGILDEGTYLEPALRGWKYLSEAALQESGKVGYCQAIGSNATSATSQSSDQPFGYGAFLLAGSEVSRWVGGVTENNLPYLQRKLWGAVAFKGGKYFAGGNVTEGGTAFEENGVTYVPASEVAGYLGLTAEEADGGIKIADELNGRETLLPAEEIVIRGGVSYVSAESMASAAGKHAVRCGDVTVISCKRTVFNPCEESCVSCLNEILN